MLMLDKNHSNHQFMKQKTSLARRLALLSPNAKHNATEKESSERKRKRENDCMYISGVFRVDASDFNASANYLYSTNHRWFSEGISYSVDRDENHKMPAQTTKT